MKKPDNTKGRWRNGFPKFDFKIKFSLLFLITTVLQLQAGTGYAQKISVNMRQASVKEVMTEIETVSKFKFFYSASELNLERMVTIASKEEDIKRVLAKLFFQTNVHYNLVDEQIVLTIGKVKTVQKSKTSVRSQQFEVSGTVTDSEGQPLPGASVIEKGTANGAQTDFDGNFTISVAGDAIIEVSYIGFTSKDVEVSGQTDLSIMLLESAENLDEVVVVGFGTQQSSKVVGSLAQVKTEDLQVNERPVTNTISALQGAIPGLVISNGNGSPGSQPNFSIRGTSSLNDTDVLVIIDNFEGVLADVDPQTIESVTVLKDASAVAVYGARGANGVLLITTKRTNRDEKVSINYNFSTSLQSKPQLPQTLNSTEYFNYQNSIIPDTWDAASLARATSGFYPETQWSDQLYDNTAFQQSHNLTLTGGSENTGYLMSASYLTQDGLAVGDDQFERLNLRLKIDTDVTDWLTIGANALISNRRDTSIPVTTGSSVRGLPLFPVISEDGFFVSNGTTDDRGNVVAQAASGSFTTLELDRVNLQMYGQFKPFKGLVLEERVSFIKSNSLTRAFTNDYDIVALDATDPDSYTNPESVNRTYFNASSESREIVLTSFNSLVKRTLTSLTYDVEKGKHSGKIFAAFQTETGESGTFQTGRRGFLLDNIISLSQGSEISNDIGNGIGNAEVRGGNATTLSYFGRLNYSFDNKYLLEAAFRADASSFFTQNNRRGYFPSVALGWVVSNENFLKNNAFINQLKFRASYGATGDDSGLGAATQQLVNFNATGYPIGGVNAGRLNLGSILNPDLVWETATIFNIGLDASLFKGKLQFQADYFENKRTDILALITNTAFEFGFGDARANPYDVDSQGWELNVTHKNKIRDFNYAISANISDYDNEISRLTGDAIGPNFQEGQSVNDRFGFVTDGFFDSQEEIDGYLADDGVTPIVQNSVGGSYVGGFKYVDQITVDTDDDGILDARDGVINNDDRVVIQRNSATNLNFGMNLQIGFKNLSLSARFYGAFYNKQWLRDDSASQPFLGNAVPFTYQTDVWSTTNPDALLPFPQSLNPVLLYNTSVDRLIIDAEFLKLQNITLSYNFDNDLLDRIGFIKSMGLYISAENIGVVWTNSQIFDQGWDPELGVNAIQYPLPFTTAVGLNVKF